MEAGAETKRTSSEGEASSPKSMRLDGKVAAITGAGQGIGQAIANVMAENGARVIVTDVVEERARQAAEALAGAGLMYPLNKPSNT